MHAMKMVSKILLLTSALILGLSNSIANADDKCPTRMSCAGNQKRMSMIPDRISQIEVPTYCSYLQHGGFSMHMVESCQKVVEKRIGTARQQATTYVNLGINYKDTGGQEGEQQAFDAWTSAMRTDPTYAQPYIQFAESMLKKHNYAAAVSLLDEAEKREPELWQIAAGKASAFLATGNTDAAMRYIKKTMRLSNDQPAAYYAAASTLEKAGQTEEAVAAYEIAGKDFDEENPMQVGLWQPMNPWAKIAFLRAGNAQYTEALDACNKAVDGVSGHRGSIWQKKIRAEILQALGRYKEAAADYDALADAYGLQLKDQNEELQFLAAIMKVKSGEPGAARSQFQNLLQQSTKRTVLKIQVFLRNNGFSNVKINGEVNDELVTAIDKCTMSQKCDNKPSL
jgi:tetratricopeptide (TPR) repeat protein